MKTKIIKIQSLKIYNLGFKILICYILEYYFKMATICFHQYSLELVQLRFPKSCYSHETIKAKGQKDTKL